MTPDTTHSTVAVFERPDQPLELREVPVPSPGPGEVLVAVRCCTLCGSDLHTLRGDRPVHGPTVLGHEIVGDIAALGSTGVLDLEGRPLAVGDRVTWSIVVPCGGCRACRRHRPGHCTARFKYGHASIDGPTPCTGGLASHCLLVGGTAIARIPAGLSDEVAATASCAAATVCASLDAAGSVDGDRVALTGAGLLGITAAAFAKQRGAREVIVVDPDSARLETARRFGADDLVHLGKDGRPQRTIADVDVAIELSGAATAVASALSWLTPGGRLILVGSVFPGRPVDLDPEDVVRRRLTIRGVHNYQPEHLLHALAALDASPAPFASVIDPPMPLDDVQTAVDRALRGGALRVAVRP